MSEIKVNKISPKQTCTQLTLGDSGDTIIIPAGATITNNGTATGFGRTGTVDWDTIKKTTGFTAVNGVGYFCDTTSSAFTATLPSTPAAGDIVALSDYTGTWGTNNLTVGRNGSNINAAATDLILNGNNTTATLIYVDATEGWRVIDTGSLSEVNNEQFIAATGGCIATCGDYKIHTFTGPGTFTVTNAGNPIGSTTVDYLVVAGGGGGGFYGGGGGAGGFREGYNPGSYTASPLATTSLPVSAQGYPITVGSGGAGAGPGTPRGVSGNNSVFSTITSTGGGGGGTGPASGVTGNTGGSGGGGAPGTVPPDSGALGGAGNTPPVAPSQGNPGGQGWHANNVYQMGGGGGGATVAGSNAPQTGAPATGNVTGGNGATTSISGSPTAYGGGGGGGTDQPVARPGGAGGTGGGGTGGTGPSGGVTGGSTNTGGGGGGGPNAAPGGSGGSGIVVIRYKFQ
jgi:hypothetical protein